jgi:hypothetical protein
MSTAIRFGFAQRPASIGSKLVVFKGYNPQSTLDRAERAPVTVGVSVLSGAVVGKFKNGTTGIYEYAPISAANVASLASVPAFALDDCTTLLNGSINGPTAYDVAATTLTALPADGQYELGTALFSAGTYTLGTYLTFDTAHPGNVVPITKAAAQTAGLPLIGIVSGFVDSPVNIYPNDNTAAGTVFTTSPVTAGAGTDPRAAGVYTDVANGVTTTVTVASDGSTSTTQTYLQALVVRFRTIYLPAVV